MDDETGSRAVRYTYLGVRQAYRWRTMRSAVLTPLLGLEWQTGDAGVVWGMEEVRAMWRARLASLREAGWPPVRESADFKYMVNCPPFGVFTDRPKMRTCKRAAVCPFCYARLYVFEAYTYLEQVLYGTTDPYEPGTKKNRRPLFDDHVLLDYRFAADVRSANWGRGGVLSDACPRTKAYMRKYRAAEARALKPLAAAVLHRVAPDRDADKLVVYKGGVALTKASAMPPPLAELYGRPRCRWAVTRADKKGLYEALGRAFAYPRYLMTGPADVVAAVLVGMAGSHMLASYGSHRVTPRKVGKKRFPPPPPGGWPKSAFEET